jgi:hypothetical protein
MLRWRATVCDVQPKDVVYVVSPLKEVVTDTGPSAVTPSGSGAAPGGAKPSSHGDRIREKERTVRTRQQNDEKVDCGPRTARERDVTAKPIASGRDCLRISESSWVARQRLRRSGDDAVTASASDSEVVRAIKSILNKLTVEKFSQLVRQLMAIEFHKVRHVQSLIQEVFEKATLQHHFINMYADLCVLLNDFFTESPVAEDPKLVFKRLLLNECQNSFERHLVPPEGLDKLDSDDRTLAEGGYKTRMLGNIKFVGALLSRRMLASKVLIAISEELLSDPTSESLESLAALLTVTGPSFDTDE